MPTAAQLYSDIKGLIRFMTNEGLVNEQRAPRSLRKVGSVAITFYGAEHLALVSKNKSYADVYRESVRHRVYSVMMLDGALVQIQYEFKHRRLLRHRLAFLPSPWLDAFHLHEQHYLEDNIDVDVTAHGWPPAPLRFDFDPDSHKDVVHPASHLTLGIVEQCRIPVARPLTPYRFVDFLLRNFYDLKTARYSDGLPKHRTSFQETISKPESKLIHIAVPT